MLVGSPFSGRAVGVFAHMRLEVRAVGDKSSGGVDLVDSIAADGGMDSPEGDLADSCTPFLLFKPQAPSPHLPSDLVSPMVFRKT